MTAYHKVKSKRGKGHIFDTIGFQEKRDTPKAPRWRVCGSGYGVRLEDLEPTTTNLCKRCVAWEAKQDGKVF